MNPEDIVSGSDISEAITSADAQLAADLARENELLRAEFSVIETINTELLAALERLTASCTRYLEERPVSDHENYCGQPNVLAQARAAIAKATK